MNYRELLQLTKGWGNFISDRINIWRLRIKHNPKNRMAIDEALLIEKFFRGQLYAVITNIDGEFLIDKLRKEVA